jgi:hypothetical protein
VRKAADKKAKEDARNGVVADGPTLRPASEAGAYEDADVTDTEIEPDDVDLDRVFQDADHADD